MISKTKIEKLLLFILIGAFSQLVINGLSVHLSGIVLSSASSGSQAPIIIGFLNGLSDIGIRICLGFWFVYCKPQKVWLWFLLALIAKWWVLPIYAYYVCCSARQNT